MHRDLRFRGSHHNALAAFGKLAKDDPDFDSHLRAFANTPLEAALNAAREARPDRSAESYRPTAGGPPTLSTISAVSHWWGFSFVLPRAALQELATCSDLFPAFVGLLGPLPIHLEFLVPLVALYLEKDFPAASAVDDGAGVYLSATWLAPQRILPTAIEWSFIYSALGGNLVLDVFGEGRRNGTSVDVYPWKPAAADNQLWTYVNGLYLVSKQSGRVLDIRNWNPKDGGIVEIWDWNGGANQQWQIGADGFIRSVMNQHVLDVKGALARPGTAVISWSQKSTGTLNQQWHVAF